MLRRHLGEIAVIAIWISLHLFDASETSWREVAAIAVLMIGIALLKETRP